MTIKRMMIGTLIFLVGVIPVGCSSTTNDQATASNPQLKKALQDELNGFAKIEQDTKTGNADDSGLASQLHNEFHTVILPPLEAKKGSAYAENIHGKYDDLQDAVASQDKARILNMIQVNRDNLYAVAKILGVSLK